MKKEQEEYVFQLNYKGAKCGCDCDCTKDMKVAVGVTYESQGVTYKATLNPENVKKLS